VQRAESALRRINYSKDQLQGSLRLEWWEEYGREDTGLQGSAFWGCKGVFCFGLKAGEIQKCVNDDRKEPEQRKTLMMKERGWAGKGN
jgi:hypothetical protein